MKRHLAATFFGALIGAGLGWFTPELQGLASASPDLRRVLALKHGLVLASLGYLVSMYLSLRRRAVDRLRRR